MERGAKILEADPATRKAVVLSACRGVTDALLSLVSLAERQDPSLDDRIEELRQRDVGIAREDLPAIAARYDGSGPIASNPRKVGSAADLVEILELAW